MTMPDERMRSLRWGCELLADLQRDPLLAPAWRDRASVIALNYPSPAELLALIEANAVEPTPMPPRFGQAIDEALVLFKAVRFASEGAGSHKTRHDLLYTLRHFPCPGSWRLLGADAQSWIVADVG